jgi:hypothetical protein
MNMLPTLNDTKVTNEVLKSSLVFYWVEKTFNSFYPLVKFEGVPDAPNSFKELNKYQGVLTGDKVLPVYNGACEMTIYNNPDHNVLFRAWHDCIHLDKGLSFSRENELKVAQEHCRQLIAMRAPNHVINTIFFDVAGQVEYYYKHGQFVVNQAAFVTDCLVYDLDIAINKAYDTALSS